MKIRWEKDSEQWWECKFIGEGIIDQGGKLFFNRFFTFEVLMKIFLGGFRDTISDISEELCPSTPADKPVPLPYFIRSPNQVNKDKIFVTRALGTI